MHGPGPLAFPKPGGDYLRMFRCSLGLKIVLSGVCRFCRLGAVRACFLCVSDLFDGDIKHQLGTFSIFVVSACCIFRGI